MADAVEKIVHWGAFPSQIGESGRRKGLQLLRRAETPVHHPRRRHRALPKSETERVIG